MGDLNQPSTRYATMVDLAPILTRLDTLTKRVEELERLTPEEGGAPSPMVEGAFVSRDAIDRVLAERDGFRAELEKVRQQVNVDWTLAFAQAVGADSRLRAPITPDGVAECLELLKETAVQAERQKMVSEEVQEAVRDHLHWRFRTYDADIGDALEVLEVIRAAMGRSSA